MLHAFVQQLVGREQLAEAIEFLAARQAAEDQHPGRLDEVRLGGELIDGDSPVAEDALFAVDVRDGALADAGVSQGRIVGIRPDWSRSLVMSMARSPSVPVRIGNSML